MKNIHVLLTDQPSRLFMTKSNKLVLDMDNPPIECIAAQHLYITSDDEFKEGDYALNPTGKRLKIVSKNNEGDYETALVKGHYFKLPKCKKIIMTTDPTLIADGVQEIDDEFLEWFVKNPSCDFVEVKFETLWLNKRFGGTWQPFPDGTATVRKKIHKIIIPKVEPKQETLEEAVKNYCSNNHAINEDRAAWQDIEFAFKDGAEWQAERSYSEEELKSLLIKALTHNDYDLCGSLATRDWEIRTANFEVWFEHNKK